MPLIDVLDTGKFLAPALLNPDLYNGKNFTCATAYYNATELVEIWTKVTGKAVKLAKGDPEAFNHLPEELKEAMKEAEGMGKFGYYGPKGREDLQWTLEQVGEKLNTFEDFVKANEPWFEG